MNIAGSVALVTGANGGIGRAFVAALLKRGAAKIYVAARDPASLSELLKDSDGRLVPLRLDVTDSAQVTAAATAVPDVTLLINNAGYAAFEGAIAAADLSKARQEMEVNYFGPLVVTRAFGPVLAGSGGGAVVNMLSMLALVSLPLAASYSASKAAALSLTRSIRAEFATQGTLVVGVLAVQTESAMGAQMPAPRLSPEEVAGDALDAVQAGKGEEVIAGTLTRDAYQAFMSDPKGFQAKMSTRLPQR
jgi:NAD(P)-dependent dehydrogenase (short-subunit alcohol dehydrogenase family)